MTCWPPVVISRSSASTRMPSAAMTSRTHSLTSARPSVGPYCSAAAIRSAPMRCMTEANEPGGNVLVSGSPPASEMTSGRSVMAIRSRIAEDFMTCVREANRPA